MPTNHPNGVLLKQKTCADGGEGASQESSLFLNGLIERPWQEADAVDQSLSRLMALVNTAGPADLARWIALLLAQSSTEAARAAANPDGKTPTFFLRPEMTNLVLVFACLPAPARTKLLEGLEAEDLTLLAMALSSPHRVKAAAVESLIDWLRDNLSDSLSLPAFSGRCETLAKMLSERSRGDTPVTQ